MRAWSDRFTVFAPDYPGFGMSDPFGEDGELELSLNDFAEVLVAFMDEIGVKSASAYGFHTGAGMAVAMADHSPRHISAVYANGYAILNEQELHDILDGYLPPFAPEWDGSHLLWLWTRNRDQLIFFPWFARNKKARIARSLPPPELLQQWAMELLRAGDHYRVGYRAAFSYPGDEPLRTLRSPAIITATETDVLGVYLSRVTDASEQVQARIGGSMEETLAEAAAFFQQHPGDVPPPSGTLSTRPVSDRAWNKTVASDYGFVRARVALEGTGRPVLLVHDLGGSCATVENLLQALRSRRPVIALDLPGHGESDPLPDGVSFLEASAAAITAVLDSCDAESVDAWGEGGGATVLVNYSQLAPQRLHRLMLSDLQAVSDDLAKELAERYAPRIQPQWHGGHLLEYWHVARNRNLFWPWYDQSDAAAITGDPHVEAKDLHVRTVALMQSAAVLPAAAQELFSYPLVGTLRKLQSSVQLVAAPSDPNRQNAEAAARELQGIEFLELPEAASASVDVLLDFLD